MSTVKTFGDVDARSLERVSPGVVDRPTVQARLREQGIVLVGGGADEAPAVYKRLPDVLAANGVMLGRWSRCRSSGCASASC